MTDPDADRTTDSTPAEQPAASTHRTDSALSRRDFLVRAGQIGASLAVVAPGASRYLLAFTGGPRAGRAGTAGMGATGTSGDAAAPALIDLYSGLRWRLLGPFRGGRVASVTGVPGRPNEFYFGAVNGGVWKSVDAGRVWTPIFDSQNVASIGALGIAPSAPDTLYVGTGESTLRDSAGYGNGVYKTTDGGKSWTHLGLADTQHIGKIAVDPHDPTRVFVAAIGHLYAANDERGVFRSLDGGKTWKKVLGDANVGAVDVVIDPSNPQVIYAGLWNTRRPPWFTYAPTNGPGGGIFKSTDGGNTWKRLSNGLPTGVIGRTGIAVAPTNPNRVYAVVDCLTPEAAPGHEPPQGAPAGAGAAPGTGGVFRSDDAGETWTKLSGDPALWGRGWYFEKIAVDPHDADTVYVPNVAVNRSMDGGKTWVALRGSPGGDDYHQTWVSPDDPNTVIQASDQGTIISRNARTADPREVTWSSWLNQPTAQMYHISVDYRFPYWVTGAQQDSGAVAVRSRGKFSEISMHDWEPIAPGGESGYTAGDRLNPGIVYGGAGTRFDLATNTEIPGTTTPKSPEKARADWTQPLVFSAADPRALYYADQYVFRTTDGAHTWERISDDLTRKETVIPSTLDATAADWTDRNDKRGVVYTIAPSPLQANTIWVGTDDGLIHRTTDGGATWHDVTPKAISPWSRVTMIDASHFDPNAAYASVDRHQLQDFGPHIFRTRDAGRTWQPITKGLPADGYVHVVKEDPSHRGLLVAGTERGAFVSFDDGEEWHPLQLDLPVTSVRDFQFYGNDLIVGTHGRGIWVIDDASTLRQVSPALLKEDVHLFQPGESINVMPSTDDGTPLQKDEPQAPNAPNGAAIDYYLRSAATGPVTIDILDASGKTVHTFTSDAAAAAAGEQGGRRPRRAGIPNVSPLWDRTPVVLESGAGMHRVVWDPVVLVPRGSADDFGRPATTPVYGTFTARLNVGGKSYTRQFVVKPDPRLATNEAAAARAAQH